MQKLTVTSEIKQTDTRTTLISHMSTSFLKGYDKMKQFNYILYQNTYTVKLIETNFYKYNQEHFLFLFQRDDFSVIWEAELVVQTEGLWVSSPYPLHRQQ